jgi:hypothetical protein
MNEARHIYERVTSHTHTQKVALNKSAYPSTEDKETNQKLFGDFTDPGGLAMKEVRQKIIQKILQNIVAVSDSRCRRFFMCVASKNIGLFCRISSL